MGILVTIFVGFVVGLIARALHPGDDKMGFLWTILLGIGGSLAASFIGQGVGWYKDGEPAGWIASTVFAIILLVIYYAVRKKA